MVKAVVSCLIQAWTALAMTLTPPPHPHKKKKEKKKILEPYLALVGPTLSGSNVELAVRAESGISPVCIPIDIRHCAESTQIKKGLNSWSQETDIQQLNMVDVVVLPFHPRDMLQ